MELPLAEKPFPFFHPLSRRLHFVLLLALLIFCMTWMRGNLAMTMTCMVNTTAVSMQASAMKSLHNTTMVPQRVQCNVENDEGTDDTHVFNDYGGTIIWTAKAQSLIFSGNFYGSLITILPSGYFADRTSPSNMLQISMLVCVICTVIFPYLAMYASYQFVLMNRVIMGLGEGIIAPAMNAMITNWLPNHEKPTSAAIFTSGHQFSGILGIPIAAAFCASTWKWPAVFYCASFLGLVWLLIWRFTVTNTPRKSSLISHQEKAYLEQAIGTFKPQKKNLKTPWKKIFTSLPFISCVLCSFSGMMVMIIIQLYIPTFFKEILFLKVVDNGFYSAAPYIVQFFVKFIWSLFMDKLKQKHISMTTACKISQGLSSLIIIIFLVLLGYLPDCKNPKIAIILVCAMGAGFGIGINGFYVSLLTIAPAYTGLISSIQMVVGYSGMIATPLLVSVFRIHGTLEEWRLIFLIIAGAKFISGIIFVIFGQAEVQSWARFENGIKNSHNAKESLQNDNEKEQIVVLIKNINS